MPLEGQEDNYVLEFFDSDSEGLSSDIYDNLDRFRNDRGLVRLWKVKREIGDIESIEDVVRIDKIYRRWVQEDEYLVFKNLDKNRYFYMKCRKRGNDVYKSDKFKKFKHLSRVIGENLKNVNRERGILKTNVVFITLTYNPSLCTIGEASKRIGGDWHRFIECLKRKYGKIEYFRVLEYHKNGFPHLHVLLFFEDFVFSCFRYNGKIRIVRKREIEKYWHSFIDVVGVVDDNGLKNSVGYLLKYVLKNVEDGGDDYTLPLSWYHNNRSYGMSRGFNDLIRICIIEAGERECDEEIIFLGVFREWEICFFMELEYYKRRMGLNLTEPPPAPTRRW